MASSMSNEGPTGLRMPPRQLRKNDEPCFFVDGRWVTTQEADKAYRQQGSGDAVPRHSRSQTKSPAGMTPQDPKSLPRVSTSGGFHETWQRALRDGVKWDDLDDMKKKSARHGGYNKSRWAREAGP